MNPYEIRQQDEFLNKPVRGCRFCDNTTFFVFANQDDYQE